jgi:hypothetical protein
MTNDRAGSATVPELRSPNRQPWMAPHAGREHQGRSTSRSSRSHRPEVCRTAAFRVIRSGGPREECSRRAYAAQRRGLSRRQCGFDRLYLAEGRPAKPWRRPSGTRSTSPQEPGGYGFRRIRHPRPMEIPRQAATVRWRETRRQRMPIGRVPSPSTRARPRRRLAPGRALPRRASSASRDFARNGLIDWSAISRRHFNRARRARQHENRGQTSRPGNKLRELVRLNVETARGYDHARDKNAPPVT